MNIKEKLKEILDKRGYYNTDLIAEIEDLYKQNQTLQLQQGGGSGSTDWRKPLIDRCKYELRRYTELAKRMDELMHECNLEVDYTGAKEAEIKRNCYNRFVNDLKQLCS